MHDNDSPSMRQNMLAKTTMNSTKLSTRLFQGRMRESGLEMRIIRRLDGTFVKTRSTLLSKDT